MTRLAVFDCDGTLVDSALISSPARGGGPRRRAAGWRGRGRARARAAAAALLCSLVACDVGDPDRLVTSGSSPDGRFTARLWCTDFCDNDEAATLTISPAAEQPKPFDVAREYYYRAEKDDVGRFFSARPMRLRWRSAAELEIIDVCPPANGDDFDPIPAMQRWRGFTIRFTCPSGPA